MCPAEHGPCEDPQTAFNHQLQLATHRLIGVVSRSVSELLWYTWTLESWLECAETLTGLSTRGSVPARVYPLIACMYWYYLLRRAERVTRREIILCLSDAPQRCPGLIRRWVRAPGAARPARHVVHTRTRAGAGALWRRAASGGRCQTVPEPQLRPGSSPPLRAERCGRAGASTGSSPHPSTDNTVEA